MQFRVKKLNSWKKRKIHAKKRELHGKGQIIVLTYVSPYLQKQHRTISIVPNLLMNLQPCLPIRLFSSFTVYLSVSCRTGLASHTIQTFEESARFLQGACWFLIKIEIPTSSKPLQSPTEKMEHSCKREQLKKSQRKKWKTLLSAGTFKMPNLLASNLSLHIQEPPTLKFAAWVACHPQCKSHFSPTTQTTLDVFLTSLAPRHRRGESKAAGVTSTRLLVSIVEIWFSGQVAMPALWWFCSTWNPPDNFQFFRL